MNINVYDFDKTIYRGDSSVDFYFFMLKKNPCIIKYIFQQTLFFILMKLKLVPKEIGKMHFFSFLKSIKKIDKEVKEFWIVNEKKISNWYILKKEASDVLISASPDFLLKPLSEKLNVKLISSLVDKNTGKFYGKNCYGKEKVLRFKKEYPKVNIKEFYSDSNSDTPMAMISKKAIKVNLKKNKFYEWRAYNEKNK